jgi:hypothetical protein
MNKPEEQKDETDVAIEHTVWEYIKMFKKLISITIWGFNVKK